MSYISNLLLKKRNYLFCMMTVRTNLSNCDIRDWTTQTHNDPDKKIFNQIDQEGKQTHHRHWSCGHGNKRLWPDERVLTRR